MSSQTRLFTPGPVQIPSYVLEAGAVQTPYFRNAEFSAVLLECERHLLEFSGAPAGSRVVFLAATGTGAMEASVANLFEANEAVVVINGGGFGQRFLDIANHCSLDVKEYKAFGENLSSASQLEPLAPAKGLLVNAHETTTGVLYDLRSIGGFCQDHNLLFVVDAISMFLTDPLDMNALGIDALIISSQKGLALPPGLAMVILSPQAQTRLDSGRSPLYFDFPVYLADGCRGQTPFTPAVTIMMQLLVRLRAIAASGLKSEIERAGRMAERFRNAVPRWPLTFSSRHMPNAMTALTPIDGRKACEIVALLESRYNICVAPNGGALRDTVFRVSHMGDQHEEDIDVLIEAFDDYYGVAA